MNAPSAKQHDHRHEAARRHGIVEAETFGNARRGNGDQRQGEQARGQQHRRGETKRTIRRVAPVFETKNLRGEHHRGGERFHFTTAELEGEQV